MATYIIKRLISAVFTLLFVSLLAFTLINLVPADPAEVALRVNDTIPSQQAIEEMRVALGLDQPFISRYLTWMAHALHLDFGVSFTNTNRLVADEFIRSLPFTLKLAGLALLITLALSIPIGVFCAIYQDHLLDRVIRFTIFSATAMPNYWLAFLLVWLFSITLGWLPSSGATEFKHFLMPALALSFSYIATYIRLIRNSMLDNMQESYVDYAYARGLSRRVIIWKHLFKNSLQSSMTAIGIGIVRLLAGTVVIESIFAIPGLGRLCLDAIFNRDYPVMQAYILIMGSLFVLINLLIDLLQCAVDPRLKQGIKQ